MPFLQLQEKHLRRLLEINVEDQKVAKEEFDMVAFEQDYGDHLKWVNAGKAKPGKWVVTSLLCRFIFLFFPPIAESPPPKAAAAPAKQPGTRPPAPKPVAASSKVKNIEEELEEDLDGFLEKDVDDGWGATIASSDSEGMEVAVFLPMVFLSEEGFSFHADEGKFVARPSLNDSKAEPKMQIRESANDPVTTMPDDLDAPQLDDEDNLDDFLEAEIDEDKINEKIETIIQVRIVSVYGDVMCLCMETSNTILN